MDGSLRDAVHRALGGDVTVLGAIEEAPHEALVSAVGSGTLVLRPEPVGAVLRRLGAGEIDGGQAQRWAAFMMNGHGRVKGSAPIEPLGIEYDPEREEEIADAVARLEEIGDLIDGELPSEEETRVLLERLRA